MRRSPNQLVLWVKFLFWVVSAVAVVVLILWFLVSYFGLFWCFPGGDPDWR